MRRSLASALMALAVAGCAATEVSPSQEASPSLRPSSTSEASSRESPTPTQDPSATPFGAAVFDDPADCVNDAYGYRVAYPSSWYSNPLVQDPLGGASIPPCRAFAPTDFDLVYGTEFGFDVAIVIQLHELPAGMGWNYGPFPEYINISDRETTVGGKPARVREIEVTLPTGILAPGDRFTEYVIELEPERYLTALTNGPDLYETSRPVLDQMMQTLEFTDP